MWELFTQVGPVGELMSLPRSAQCLLPCRIEVLPFYCLCITVTEHSGAAMFVSCWLWLRCKSNPRRT